jgi:hypothetical protein
MNTNPIHIIIKAFTIWKYPQINRITGILKSNVLLFPILASLLIGCSEQATPVNSYSGFGDIDSTVIDSTQIYASLLNLPIDSLYSYTDLILYKYFQSQQSVKQTLPSIVQRLNDSCVVVDQAYLDCDSLGIAIKFINGKFGGYAFQSENNFGSYNLSMSSEELTNNSWLNKSVATNQPKILAWCPITWEWINKTGIHISEAMTNSNLSFKLYQSTDCDINVFLKEAMNYDIVVIESHGSYHFQMIPDFYTIMESASTDSIIRSHFTKAGLLLENTARQINEKAQIRKTTVMDGLKWFQDTISTGKWLFEGRVYHYQIKNYPNKIFNNSLVYMNVCFSMEPDKYQFRDALIAKGAKTIMGWDKGVNQDFATNTGNEILGCIYTGKELYSFLKSKNYVDPTNAVLKIFPEKGTFSFSSSPTPAISPKIASYMTAPATDTLKKYGLSINNGLNPPNLKGIFKITPAICDAQNFQSNVPIGHQFDDVHYCFYNQAGDLSIASKKYTGTNFDSSQGYGGFIFGSNDSFTIYLDESGSTTIASNKITYKRATVITGQVTPAGINNLKYGFIITDKQNDINDVMMDVGQCRVIRDDDKFSEKISNDTTMSSANPAALDWFRQKQLDSIVIPTYGKPIGILPEVIASSDWNGAIFLPKFGVNYYVYPNKNILWIDFEYEIKGYTIENKFSPAIMLPFKPVWARFFQSQAVVGNYSVKNILFEKIGNSYYAKIDSVIISSQSKFQAVLEIKLPFMATNCVTAFIADTAAASTFSTWMQGNTLTSLKSFFASSTKYQIPGIYCDLYSFDVSGNLSTCPVPDVIAPLWQSLEEYNQAK